MAKKVVTVTRPGESSPLPLAFEMVEAGVYRSLPAGKNSAIIQKSVAMHFPNKGDVSWCVTSGDGKLLDQYNDTLEQAIRSANSIVGRGIRSWLEVYAHARQENARQEEAQRAQRALVDDLAIDLFDESDSGVGMIQCRAMASALIEKGWRKR